MKRSVARVLTSPALRWAFRGWTRRAVPVLMLHRFSATGRDGRTSPESLGRALEAVRREGLEPLTLGALAENLREGRVPSRAICFTIDDGYRDFKEIGHPVFARYEVPVTLFATAGFVEGPMWHWWDRVQYCFDKTEAEVADLHDALGRPLSLSPGSDRRAIAAIFVESCKEVADARRLRSIDELERSLGVAVPERPVEDYAALDWNDLRDLAGHGVEFGAHTVSHPILSRVEPAELHRELDTSVAMLEAATGQRVTTFAYPNGRNEDFNDATVQHLKSIGVRAAVTTEPGVVDRDHLTGDDALLRLPRLSFPEQRLGQEAIVSGLEAAKIAWGWR